MNVNNGNKVFVYYPWDLRERDRDVRGEGTEYFAINKQTNKSKAGLQDAATFFSMYIHWKLVGNIWEYGTLCSQILFLVPELFLMKVDFFLLLELDCLQAKIC